MGKKGHIKKRVLLPSGGGGSSAAAATSSSAAAAATTAAPPPSAGGGSVDDLVAAAEAAVDQLDLETAAELYEAALERCPDEPRLLDALGEVCFQTGDAERAGELFTQSVALQPDGPNFTRYMYLAQLSEGPEAVKHYSAGVACLRSLLAEAEAAAAAEGGASSSSSSAAAAAPEAAASPSAADRASLLRRELSKALCGLAELYMTDLCDEDGAEAACEGYATAAVAADGACAEAHRVLADLRLCQKRPSDSLPLITRSVALMEACYPPEEQEVVDGGAAGEDDEEMDGGGAGAGASSSSSSSSAAAAANVDGAVPALLRGDPLAALPSYDSRLRAAQIALEVEAYAPAVAVLERLLAEDDSDMQVWFLLGEALLHAGDPEQALERLTTADEMLSAAISRIVAMARSALRAGKAPNSVKKKLPPPAAGLAAAASDGLMQFSRAELEGQRKRIRELLAVVQAAVAGGGGGAGAGAASGSA